MTTWPFTTAELTAGLRRYFVEPSLQVKSVRENPRALAAGSHMGRVRGLSVDYVVGETEVSVDCVVKEPRGTTRAGLAGAGQREIGLYRSLAPQLPMATPALVAADPAGEWLVLEAVEAEIAPDTWRAEDYQHAVRQLAALHERFWNLADDLAAYQWLARPLANDFEIHVYAAAQAMENIIAAEWPPQIAGSLRVVGALAQIISQVETVVQPLRAAPQTLLHGGLAPSNVALMADGEMVVFDWRLAGLGPGVLDLVAFITASRWQRPDWPVTEADLIACYRDEMARRLSAQWPDDEWLSMWDHAFLWRFVQEMLGWAANAPRDDFAARADDFVEIWLNPVLAAAEGRLRPILYV